MDVQSKGTTSIVNPSIEENVALGCDSGPSGVRSWVGPDTLRFEIQTRRRSRSDFLAPRPGDLIGCGLE